MTRILPGTGRGTAPRAVEGKGRRPDGQRDGNEIQIRLQTPLRLCPTHLSVTL
jgi:hypothetical protein